MSGERRTTSWRAAAFVKGSVRQASALWVFAILFLVFALWVPDTFLTSGTWRNLLDQQAVTALVAVGLVAPFAAGAFDLSAGAGVGFGAILVAWLLSKMDLPVVPAVVLAVAAGAIVGMISGLLVVRAHIGSFIATLGISSVLLALISWISGDQQIIGLSEGFQWLGNTQVLGVSLPVFLMLAVAVVVHYVLERTALGRRVYATGGNEQAARLVGVRTSRIIVGALTVSGATAAFAGVLISSELATGDPTIGPPYLLPAFTACFLGSTQFRRGRFNVWGTVCAVYVLATGVKGLQLAGAPTWIPDMFNGIAMLIAVGVANHERVVKRKAGGAQPKGNSPPASPPPARSDAEPSAASRAMAT
jgi:ribose transport system permease protein